MVHAVKGLLMGLVVKTTTELKGWHQSYTSQDALSMDDWVCGQHSPVKTIFKLSALDAILLLLSPLAFCSSTVRCV